MNISQEQIDFYHENGYLILEHGVPAENIQRLRDETVNICRGVRGNVRNLPAFDPADDDDTVIQRTLCIHFPHKISETMLEAVHYPGIVNTLTGIIGENVKCMQSMLFIKSAGKPGQAWHQDEDFIPTRDRSLTGAWIALDDATVENGCLWIIPGSHKHGILWEMEKQNSPDFDCTDTSVGFPYRDEDAIPVEVPAGTIVFFNGYTLHRSLPNRAASGYRRALVMHYMSAESLLPWQPTEPGSRVGMLDHRDIIMVAGNDPYSWKGVADIMTPHIRPFGDGGCKWNEDADEEEEMDRIAREM